MQMKPSFHFSQPNKDSQTMIRQILDQNNLFNLLQPSMITQILLAFKVNEANLLDKNMKVNAIKQKLLDMIIDQRDQCVSYLILPKFNNISENTKNILKEIINTTWNTFSKRQVQDQKNKKYVRYFCRTDNLKQAEDFHIGLFNLFKSAYFYESPSFYRMLGGYPPIIPPPNPESYQNFSQMPISAIPPDPFFSMGITPSQTAHVKIQDDKNGMSDVYNPSKQQTRKYKKRNVQTPKKPQFFQNVAIFENFLSCACKGKFGENERCFQCEDCFKQFHLKCLNIPPYATEKIGLKKNCPQCCLKNTHAMYSAIGDPLQTFWSDDKELHKQKIIIKGKKCKQILQKKYLIQIKFLKIQGRTMYDWQSPAIRNLNNQKPRQSLNQVLIKDQVLTKGNGDDVKISLDCMKSTDKSQDRKPILLFVTVNVVKQKTVQEILVSNYDYFEQDYLDKFMKDKNELKIEIFDIKFKIFRIPVRGSDCEHPELYDLEQFASHSIDLQNDACFICPKRCRKFKIDLKILNEINKIKQTFADQSQYPQAIYYQKDGTFKWNSQNQQPKHLSNESEENKPDQPASQQQPSDIQFSSLALTPMKSQSGNQQQQNKKKNKTKKIHKSKG